MVKSDPTDINLEIDPSLTRVFYQLLSQGFRVDAPVGISIQELLCDHLGISKDYLRDRIQTLFLDGKPVDDTKKTIILSGSTLALSAAMPGLVGATLRKGGRYAMMRLRIDPDLKKDISPGQREAVTIKLFNLVLKDLGPLFLKTGIRIKGDDFKDFFSRQPDLFWAGCVAARVNGETVEPKDLPTRIEGKAEVILTV